MGLLRGPCFSLCSFLMFWNVGALTWLPLQGWEFLPPFLSRGLRGGTRAVLGLGLLAAA